MANRRNQHHDPLNPGARRCDWQGCMGDGLHRAPKQRYHTGSNDAGDYYWFCETHIREFNQRWDYFAGMSSADIEAFQREAVVGHRPTWRPEHVGSRTGSREAELEAAIHRFYHGHRPADAPPMPTRRLSQQHIAAFAVLELSTEAGLDEVKKRYKALVKQLHPDVNKGDASMEERFRRVVEAYQQLQSLFE